MDFRFDIIINAFPLLIEGAIFTIQITALSVAIGIIIGLFVGVARISKIRIIKWLAAIYVDFLRGTPLLVQIFLIYFALPVLTGIKMNPFVAAIAACSINSGAYVAEIFRLRLHRSDPSRGCRGSRLSVPGSPEHSFCQYHRYRSNRFRFAYPWAGQYRQYVPYFLTSN